MLRPGRTAPRDGPSAPPAGSASTRSSTRESNRAREAAASSVEIDAAGRHTETVTERRDDRLELPVSHGGVWSNRGGLMFMPLRVLVATLAVALVAVVVAAIVYVVA
jgi:hypothetical protein